ncbi:MAG: T9SS type A sorting domain-containing protein, partial [Crocinitomicaceae bacterium]
VTFLDDNRSIQIRTNNTYWGASDFVDGTLLTLVSGKLDTTIVASVAKIDMVEVIAASNNIPSVFVNTTHLDENEQAEFRVFPNPSSGKFTISSTIEGDYTMKVLSLEGKLIRSHNHVGSQSEIDLTGIESGVYLLQSERSLNCLKLMVR